MADRDTKGASGPNKGTAYVDNTVWKPGTPQSPASKKAQRERINVTNDQRTGFRRPGIISKGAAGPGKGATVISSMASDRDPGAGTDRTKYLGGAAAKSGNSMMRRAAGKRLGFAKAEDSAKGQLSGLGPRRPKPNAGAKRKG